jgi:hypothetical protein
VLLWESKEIRHHPFLNTDRTYHPLFLADPELVESAKTGENASTQPTAVPAFYRISRRVDFDLQQMNIGER